MISRLFFNRNLALAVLIFSIGMVFVALSSATEAAPPTPEKDESKLQLEPVEAQVVSKDMAESGLYIVQLHDAPLASYRGGVEGLRATNPAAKGEKKLDVKAPESVAYLEYLDRKRAEAITEVGQTLGRQLSVAYEYKASLNGFAAEMTPAEAAMVAKLPTIKHIEADTVEELHTDAGPAWIGAPAIWGADPNIKQFETELSGDNGVPPVMTDTSGTGMFTYNMMTGELHYAIEHDAVNVTAMHIHTGTAGVIGGVAFPLDHTTGTGTVTLTTDAQRHALMNEGYYVNVHTTAFPSGELRGQITALHFFNAAPFEAELSGLNEEPPVTDTMASGLGTFSFDAETNELDYMIEVSDIMSITKIHIHTGTVGTNGSSLHWLYDVTGVNAASGDFPISGTVTLSDTELAPLWTSGLYINVHTEDNPPGEIRGQIEQVGTLGEGIIVGIIDTGIDPWNPSFLDVGDDGYDHTNPWGDGTYVGVCDPNDASYDPTFECNDKLIGAWGYATVNGGDARDYDGHGSHTGGTAAGNVVFNPTVETPSRTFTATMISGVAPHANVIAYTACCTGAALSAARDQVVLDGVDVVNYSIGSTAPTNDPWNDAEEIQWLNIRDAGIFVATSAGNAGPGDETVGSPGDVPWMTTVGANSHNRAFLNSVTLDDGTNPPITIDGLGMTGGLDTPVEIVFSSAYTASGQISAEDARLCADDVFSGTVDFGGAIVVCERGEYGRVAKGQTVADAGAGGYILAQPNEVGGGPGALASDPHVIPGVHIDYYAYQDLLAYVNNAPGAVMGTISGATLDIDDAHADIMASFSSRGANRAFPDMIVPNVTAPGRSIWAAYGPGENDGDYTFNVIQGTSMASPHVAGSGALMMALHPDWTPAEIESALMTTARSPITNDDGTTDATPFAEGSGEVDLRRAPHAGIVLDITTQEFVDANPAEGGDPKDLNRASMGNSQCLVTCSWTRTVRSTLGMTVTWNAAVTATPGVTLTGSVEPATFELAPGASQELVITVDVSQLPEAEWFFAELMLTPSTEVPEAHMPIAVQSSSGVLPSAIEIDTRRNAGSQLVEGIEAIEITDLTVEPLGLAQAHLSEFELYQDPTNSIPEGFYDDLSQVFTMTIDVPADSYSLIADIISSESPDLDMAVGFDTDGDGEPEGSEEICQSAGGSWTEFCEILSPQAGTWWVVVLNWSESDNAPDAVTLATAVVPNSDNANMTVDGPDSQPSGEPFDLRIFWDTPEMMAGDRWYGYLSLGSDGANAGNIGTIPVYLNRHPDDVTKEVSNALVEAGDMVTYTITVQPNVTREDLTYSLTDTIPVSMTYVADSASATEGTVDVTDGVLTWNGTLATPFGVAGSYVMSTSADDAMCDTGFDGYVNLQDFGILAQSGITGDTVLFTGFTTGDPINYYGSNYTGMGFSDDGFAIFDSANYSGQPWVPQAIPNAALPNNVLAALWQDFEIFYDETLNHGVSLATAGSPGGVVIVEYDDVQFWGGSSDTFDFEIIVSRAVDNTPGVYEIVYAYDNLNGDLTGPLTIGVEDSLGANATSLVNNDSAEGVISNGFMVCFDYEGPSFDPVVITFQAMADEGAAGEITNTVDHNTDNPGSMVEMASATTEVYDDGIDDETEDGAPNGGDGNGDGIPDSEQDNVASLPNAGDEAGYVTFETPEGILLTNISVSPAPMTLPTGIEAMPQGLFDFTIEGLTLGESVTVTLYLYGSESELNNYFKYDEGATDPWIDVTSIATFETTTISDTTVTTVMLHLTDGGLGDLDGEENGIIVDPGGPARTAPTSISVANFGQEASLAWQPIALLALLVVLVVGGGVALLQRRSMV